MLDIFIAVGLGLLTLATAYLGVHVTLHGAETDKARFWYKAGFATCGACACVLIGLQAYRSEQAQKANTKLLTRIDGEAGRIPPTNFKLDAAGTNPLHPFVAGSPFRGTIIMTNKGPSMATEIRLKHIFFVRRDITNTTGADDDRLFESVMPSLQWEEDPDMASGNAVGAISLTEKMSGKDVEDLNAIPPRSLIQAMAEVTYSDASGGHDIEMCMIFMPPKTSSYLSLPKLNISFLTIPCRGRHTYRIIK